MANALPRLVGRPQRHVAPERRNRRMAWINNHRLPVTVMERNGNLTLVRTDDGHLEWLTPSDF